MRRTHDRVVQMMTARRGGSGAKVTQSLRFARWVADVTAVVMMHRIGTFAGVALALALVVACGTGGDGDMAADPVEPESAFVQGPHRVGFIARSVTFASMSTGEERTIPLRVWYPADEDALVDLAEYGLGDLVDLLGSALDAPAVSPDGPFPVAVYSHGSGSDGLLAYPYAEHLAGHGWIVVAPNHVGNTSLDRVAGTEIPRARSLAVRPEDVSASLDSLQFAAGDIGLDGAVDLDDVLMIGHSRGGTTALRVAGARFDVDALVAACESDCDAYDDPAIASALESSRLDPRIGAVVAQAPASVLEFGEGELAGIAAPTMLMTGDLDITVPDADSAWELLDGEDDVWIRLPRGAHLSFVTICEDLGPILDVVLPTAANDGCGPGFIPPADAVEALRGYALVFGLRHTMNEPRWDVVLQPPSSFDGLEIVAR